MAKQLNVNLAFTADTGKAKAQLQELQKSLDSLVKGSVNTTKLPLTKELQEAQNAAASLKVALDSAINMQTGKLDITKFSSSMKNANLDATTLRKHLEALGPSGNQAFLSLTKSVMSAEMPIRRTNALISELWVTMKNTARWQLSSSMLHGFMGAVQSAYGYAQDLNESLNNIRIVTGQSSEEMAAFADRASKAAKTLSTTTTKYTDASLIYYQQGLSDAEVAKRTEVTVKMANAAGQSAQIVSDQLTSIWNNFYDGSKSLEYYADVLTALGAATASSTDEISGGLEKFAGIAETVGLSYEYAASALATITATSRESEEVVGTALKTIFARIQGLSLGETLEDGVDLNKYSQALAKVGVDVLNADGSLKAMDQTLEDLAARWDTLTNAEQVATAQAVAGVRQYNQLTTLMDNWDFMEQNLETARNSEGTLSKQADIYAESWEAARNRVKAASEDLFDSILDEDFFITILNTFEKAISLASTLVDSLGGLPGILATVGALVTKIFSKQLETSIDNMIYGINTLTGTNLKNSKATKEEYAKEAENISFNDVSSEGEAIGTGLQQQTQMQKQLLEVESQLSAAEKSRIQHLMDIHQLYVDQAAAAGKAADAARQIVQEQNKEARIKVKRAGAEGFDAKAFTEARAEMTETIKIGKKAQGAIEFLGKSFDKIKDSPQALNKQLTLTQERLDNINSESGSANAFRNLVQDWDKGIITADEMQQKLLDLAKSNEVLDDAVIAASDNLAEKGKAAGITTKETDAMANSELKLQQEVSQSNKALKAQSQEAANIKVAIAGAKGATDTLAKSIVSAMQGISQITMAVSGFSSIIDTLNNEDMTFGEKVLSITMSLSMAIPSLIAGISALTAVKWADIAASSKQLIVSGAELAIMALQKVGLGGLIGAKTAETAATLASAAANMTWQATALPILAITLAITAAIAALVLIVWGVVAAFNAFKASTPEGQLKAAKEEAEELATVLDDTKQAAEELKAAFDGYDSAVEALENCIEGTQEWYNALRDVNNEVLSLLSSYPELASMVNEKGEKAITKGKDGEFVVADWAKEQLTDQANQAVLNTQVASSRANRNVRDAELKVQRSELASSVNSKSGTTASKTYQGNTIDVSSMVSSYIAKNAEALSSMTSDQQAEALKSYFESNDISADVDSWVSAITDLGPEFGQLASAVEANTAATQLENEILANEILAENKAVQASDYTDQITSVVGHDLDKLVDSKEQELIDSGWGTDGISKATGVNDEARKIFAEYAEAADITDYDLTDTTGTDDNRAFVYTDENNESVTVTLDAMRAVVAAAEANTEVANNATNLVETFSNKTESEVAEMTAAVTQDVKDLTVAQTQEGYEVAQLSSDDLKALGFESQAEYEEAFNQLAEGASSALSDIIDDYVQSVQDSMNALKDSGALNDLTLEEVDALGSTMEEVFAVGGQAALDNFSGIFESIDTEQRDEFVNTLGSIDWQTTNVDSLKQKLEEAGVSTTNLSEGALQSLIDIMQSGAVNLEAATAKYASLHEIVDNLKTGDIISEEDFNKFEEYGIAADDYFMRMADGTYKLIGDAEEFYNKVNGESLEGLEETVSAARLENDTINNLMSGPYNTMDKLVDNDQFQTYGGIEVNTDSAQTQAQLDFLSASGWGDATTENAAQLKEWQEAGTLTVEQAKAIRDAVDESGYSFDQLSEKVETNNQTIEDGISGILSSANSLAELQEKAEANGATQEDYGKALLGLASKYENCTNESQDYQKALKNGTDQQKKAAKSALEASVRAGELGEQYGLSAEEIERYANELKASGKYSKATDKALVEMAKDQMRFDKAVVSASENMETWEKDLAVAAETGHLVSETAEQMSAAYGDLLDIDGSQLSADFLNNAENLELMKQALEGNQEAYQQLQEAAGKDILARIGIDTSQWDADLAAIEAKVMEVEGMGLADIEAGASLDDSGFLAALTDMVNAAGMTAQEATDYLSSMGVDAEVINKPEEVEEIQGYNLVAKTGTKPVSYIGAASDGTPISLEASYPYVEYTTEPVKTTKTVAGTALEVTSASKSSGGNVKHSGSTTANGGSNAPKKSGGGGGGGSKPKKAEPTKKSDVIKRYKELEDQLDDIRKEADHTKDSLDRLYGEEQEAAIERLLELERQEIELIKEKKREAEKYLQEDLKELKKVSAQVDVEFEFDKEGNISNYEEEMTELYEELHRIESAAGSEWDENEQEEINTLKEKISKLEEAIEAYEETKELLQDINYQLDEMAGTPPLPLIKSDYLDIYLEVEDKLDDIEEKISDLERQAEGLTGEERLKVLRQIQELEEERLKTLEDQKEIARQDMEDKKAAMEEIAERNDLNFEYDENGNITNYLSEMEKLNKAYEELYDEVTKDGLVTDTELAALDAMREDMEQMEDYAQGYRQAMEAVEDIQNEIEEKGSGKTNDRFVRSDHIDIYKETNDQLDDIDEKIADLEREADRLTGDERIAKLREIQKLEKQRLDILKKQKDIAKQDMEDRKAALEEIATLNELIFEYDENGNITNYDEQMDKLIKKYEDAYTEFMEDGVITDTEQAILDAINQDIQELEDAIDAYSDAVEEMEDIQNEMEEIAEGGYVDMDQLDEIGDKLHDINQELDDIEEAINDSAKAADRLYGAARIKQMDKTTKMLEEEIDALERKKELQKEIVAEEKSELDEFSKGQVKYDSNGNITNYHDLVDGKKDEIRAREAELKADGDFTEAEAAEIQEMIDELERLEEEIDEYEQALEDQEDIENAIDDAYYEWQDLNAEKLSYKLELTLDVNDRELAKIERQINRLEGNFYSRAEALALMVGGGMNGNSKLGELNSQLGDLQAHYAEVKQAYEAGEISHADYVAQTQQIQAEIENTAAAMEDLQAQMDSYYKDTLAQARQELSFYTAQMEHLTGVLGHFKNILTTLGKSQDYDMMGVVLEGQVETLENEVQVAKKAMGMWQQEADEAYAKYQQALASGNQENANMYYQAYQEALNAANEAENKYYSKAQQWAQALKALMENTLAGLGQDLENALTGGTSFETVNTSLKRAASLQEEYLTTTNKIYETTKMMRTAQNEIDKTTNSVAKRKLANFITETKQMQNQNKLSKYELSIQQAKYDLLLAEIALEEARYAKSTVRLQRDSEGNFGYVYTADAEAINNAEQQFEDAQNKLYNIGLDGANKYTEKYQQTMAEMYDTLTDLQNKYLQGGFESEEEYNTAVTEAKEYYYEKLQQYSDLYSIALTTDSRVVADAWSTDFADMTQRTEEWMNTVTDYLGQVREAFAEWERESDRIANETVGTNLDTLKQKVGGIVSESEVLTGTINNSVIPAIQAEIDEVQRLTDAYANMAGSMQGAIDKAYELSDALQKDIDASVEQEMAKQDQETNTEENPTENEPVEQNPTENEPTDPGGTTEPPPTENPDTGEPEGETEPPHTHSYGDWKVTEKASCTKSGKKERKCACGDVKTETIPKKGHKAGSKWKYDKEYHWHECTECGAKMDKAKHTIKDGKCSVCGYKPDSKSNNILEVGDTPIYKSGKYYHDSYGTDPAGSRGQGKKVKVTQVIKNPKSGQDYPIHVESNDSAYGWLKASQLEGYDTGGYTGAWGPFGKLAMLHEKELILNKEDTENFLASLELLDSILSTIDLYAMNSQFNTMINSPYIPDLGKETLEQMVSIEASFPNATDKQEIEDAFKSLVNLASQYANRK